MSIFRNKPLTNDQRVKKIIGAEEDKNKQAPVGELGDSGTSFFDGIITDEYVAKLSGSSGIGIYNKMRKSDGTVRSVVLATSLPIRRASWFIQPVSEDQADKDIAEFVKQALFEYMTITWEDFLRQALLMLPLGVMAFEKVFTMKEIDGQPRIIWQKFAPRLPHSITSWMTPEKQDGLTQSRIDGNQVGIPMEKLLIFCNEKEGDNWWGTPILRAAYKSWYYKTGFEKIDAVAFERQGLGIPFAKMPEGYTADEEQQAEILLKNTRAHQNAYLIEPDNFSIEFKDMKATTTRDPKNSIAYHNREITKSVLAQFLELGASPTGSRALSSDQTDLFLQSLEATANSIMDVINKYAIKQLVDFNFNVTDYPTLEYAGISRVDAESLSKTYQQLTQSGGMKPIDTDEAFFRGLLGLPERNENDIAEEDQEVDQSKEEEINDKLESSDFFKNIVGNFKRLLFADNPDKFKSWRKLTFAEKKVDFKRINEMMDKLESELNEKTIVLLNKAKDDYLKKLTYLVNNKDRAAIKTLEIKYQNDYKQMIADILKQSFIFGKNNVAKEMGVKSPVDPAEITANYNTLADAIVQKHAADIHYKSKQGLVEGLQKGAPVAQIIGDIDKVLAEQIKQTAVNTSAIVVGEAINQGRDVVFQKHSNKIYALQRSEILDGKTCNYCLSMDGRIIEKDDKMSKIGVYHSFCRGIWVEILTDETEKPKITGVPQSLRDRFGDSVNNLIQPKNPIVKKSSLANKFLNK